MTEQPSVPPEEIEKQFHEYLLGRMDPARARTLETVMKVTPQLSERYGDYEDSLIRSYYGGELNKKDARAFETYYLASNSRRLNAMFVASQMGENGPAPRVPTESFGARVLKRLKSLAS